MDFLISISARTPYPGYWSWLPGAPAFDLSIPRNIRHLRSQDAAASPTKAGAGRRPSLVAAVVFVSAAAHLLELFINLPGACMVPQNGDLATLNAQ
jgi:hypothetical protein